MRSLRSVVAAAVAGHTFSGLNFVFSDGIKLYAYRLGVFDLFWTTRPGVALVASEKLTSEAWHCAQQDVLLTLDPETPEEVRAERLLGDMLLGAARIERLEPDDSMRGAERGAWAADHASRVGNLNGAARSPLRASGSPAEFDCPDFRLIVTRTKPTRLTGIMRVNARESQTSDLPSRDAVCT